MARDVSRWSYVCPCSSEFLYKQPKIDTIDDRKWTDGIISVSLALGMGPCRLTVTPSAHHSHGIRRENPRKYQVASHFHLFVQANLHPREPWCILNNLDVSNYVSPGSSLTSVQVESKTACVSANPGAPGSQCNPVSSRFHLDLGDANWDIVGYIWAHFRVSHHGTLLFFGCHLYRSRNFLELLRISWHLHLSCIRTIFLKLFVLPCGTNHSWTWPLAIDAE